MKGIEERAIETKKYLDEKKELEIQDYNNWDEKYRQNYWIRIIFTSWRRSSDIWTPLNLSKIRKNNISMEPNLDIFLPWVIKFIEEEWFEIEEIIILDEQAKKALGISNEISWNSKKIEEIIKEETKTEEIEWIDISFDELSERIWDLYYDSLSSFLSDLSDSIDNNDIKKLVKEASINISNAWDLCKVPTEKFIEEAEKKIKAGEKVFFKHTDTVKWLNIDNKKLANLIWNLVDSELSKFLERLSKKMQKDWDADYYRKPKPRQKLGTELYSCADKLNQVSKWKN